ncbi:MAG: bifunctional pantoate--beta-alanine ligase/(d)CMP kinase [Thermosynechococcaceae cyanobacterium MS004]|nr:bifunctional pantoate--beta-alanine ligase/(d)CMP kinase [Thermosynechococcaceae cyanobacterium MS004]
MTNPRVSVLKTAVGLQCFLDRCFLDQETRSSSTQSTPSLALIQEFGHLRPQGLGLVPTMGALHAGHLSLIQRARQENAVVVVSIFVNPLQFAPGEDFARYPRSLAADLELCQSAGVDAVFMPEASDLLSQEPMTQVMPPPHLTDRLCGRSRPGHFEGVATIVLKLLSLVQPTRAYFGRKDAQQLAILQTMVRDLSLSVDIVPCPILREPSGLAYSSRNQYLTSVQRQQAAVLSQSLTQAQALLRQGYRDRETLLGGVRQHLAQEPAVQLEYLEFVHPETLAFLSEVKHTGMIAIAARIGTTRLIDNVVLDGRRPILAIDGPAGAGKSTVTRRSAAKLGLLYLDTGAMYRAMTWLVLQSGLSFADEVAIADLVSQANIELFPGAQPTDPLTVRVNGTDVTAAIRSLEVTSQVSTLAAQPAVRQILKQQQQAFGQQGGIAAEGRDIGTHVFPDAGLKIFLTASHEERARRRYQELQAAAALSDTPSKTPSITYEQLVTDIAERDRKDSQRAVAPLRKAEDAVELLTDGLSIDEVVDEIVTLYHKRCADPSYGV